MSSFTLGECASIGIGVGLGSLVVVLLLLLWSRWFLRRTRVGYEMMQTDLRERLMSTDIKKNRLELEGDSYST